MQSIIILGRQPLIGMAELESLYGAASLRLLGSASALMDMSPAAIDFQRLGGAIKMGYILGKTNQANLEKAVFTCLRQLDLPPKGKITLGISGYGLDLPAAQLTALAIRAKKMLRGDEQLSVRVIPNRSPVLNSAQVLHNKLATEHGIELLLVSDSQAILIARTVSVQNITSYTGRDRQRPKRDSYVGMLPPKLAQIIINLATCRQPPADHTVLDCGTGVILQEALLMGFNAYGSDIDQRMVDFSLQNLAWLRSRTAGLASQSRLETGDARSHSWQTPISAVATESYLGRPLKTPPANLADMIITIDNLHKKFLINIQKQLLPGTRLCLALPAWYVNDAFTHP